MWVGHCNNVEKVLGPPFDKMSQHVTAWQVCWIQSPMMCQSHVCVKTANAYNIPGAAMDMDTGSFQDKKRTSNSLLLGGGRRVLEGVVTREQVW